MRAPRRDPLSLRELPEELIPLDPRFGAGPGLVPSSRLEILTASGPTLIGNGSSSRRARAVVREIKELLAAYLELPPGYEVVLGSGGEATCFDLVGLNLVARAAHVFVCGASTAAWHAQLARIPWIAAGSTGVRPGTNFDFALDQGARAGADTLCVTLNEISTGVWTPVLPAADPSRGPLIVVDGTSGCGQLPCDFSRLDVCFFTPDHVFGAEGGVWVAVMSPRALERSSQIARDQGRYVPGALSLGAAIERSRADRVPATASMCTLLIFREALLELRELGLAEVARRGRLKAELVYAWAEAHRELRPFVDRKELRSSTVVAVESIGPIRAMDLIETLEASDLAYGLAGPDPQAEDRFRIATFPSISEDNLRRLTRLISFLIERRSDLT